MTPGMYGKNKKMIVALALISIFVIVVLIIRFQSPSQGHVQDAIQSAVSDPKGFVKRQVNGGIGVALAMNPVTKLPEVNMVLLGSPAEMAGLQRGDILTKVGDTPTAGKSIQQVVDLLRGFTLANVSLTVQRGSNNMNFLIKRTSWNSLGVTNVYSSNTNVVP